MSKIKLKALALFAFAFVALASSSAHATIRVAVAANFTSTMNTLIAAFKLLYPGTNVIFTAGSSAVLRDQIVNRTVIYDLFLSADLTRPRELAIRYPSLVIGGPFLYAVGELELWSPTINIRAGLPFPLRADIVIADPTKAPYGLAATDVLASAPWRVTGPFPNPGQHVFIKSNISQTYSAIKNGAYPYGFIAQSSICKVVRGVKTFSAGYHHTYPFNDRAHPHRKISQYAIRLANAARTPAQNAELANFVRFITTNVTGKNIIRSYCYSLS